MAINMKVEKMKKRIRKWNYQERWQLMDWLQSWYDHEKNCRCDDPKREHQDEPCRYCQDGTIEDQ